MTDPIDINNKTYDCYRVDITYYMNDGSVLEERYRNKGIPFEVEVRRANGIPKLEFGINSITIPCWPGYSYSRPKDSIHDEL